MSERATPEQSSRLSPARATRDELVRQLLLERQHDYVRVPKADGWVVPAAVERSMQGFPFQSVTQPALLPLVQEADRVVLRVDGLVVNVVAIQVVKEAAAPLTERITLEQIVEMGAALCGLTGRVNAVQIPVTFQLVVIFSAGIPADFREQAQPFARRGVASPKVAVGVVALDADSGAVWSNYPGLVRFAHQRLVSRAWREREMTREAREALFGRTGFRLDRALLGAACGGVLGVAGSGVALAAGVREGKLYGGLVLLASALAAVISIKTCRIAAATMTQAGVAGGIAAVAVLAGGIVLFGMEATLSGLLLLAMSLLLSVMLGAAENPSGRTVPR